MKEKNKTKAQLVAELEELRKRNAELKESETKSKQNQKKKRDREELYHNIINCAGDGIIFTDKKGTVIVVNNAFTEITGISKEYIVGKKAVNLIKEFVKPNNVPIMLKLIKKMFSGVPTESYELEYQNKILEISNPFPGTKEFGITGVIRDITVRKKAEETLLFYREMIKNMTDGVYFVGVDDVIIKYTNRKFEEMFGYNTGEMIGKNASIVNAPTDKDPLERATEIMKVIRETGKWRGEVNNIKKDGKPFWCFANVSVFEHPLHGKVLMAVHTDITERKKVDDALSENEEKYRNLIETSQDLIFQCDKEGCFIYLNENWEKTLGYSIDEMLGLKHSDFKKEDIARRDNKEFERVLKEGSTKGYETSYVSKSGDDVHLSFTAMLLYDKEGRVTGTIGTADDITERKDADEAQRQAEKEIKASLKEKEILLKEIHHRVKNNLQIISSLLKLKSENIKSKKVAEVLSECQNCIKSMVIVHEKFHRSDNLSKINFKEYIYEIANHLVRTYYPNNTDKVSLIFDVEDVSLGINVAIPCGLVLNELISNSLKHAFPAGRRGQINISMRNYDENIIKLVVKDNGIGIPKDFDLANVKTLGVYLIFGIVKKQLQGKIEYNRSTGTIANITFKNQKLNK